MTAIHSLAKRQHASLGLITLLLGLSLWGLARWQRAAFPVTLVIDGQPHTIFTHAADPSTMLRALGYHLRPEDRLEAPAWGPGARVILHRARPIQILADGHSRTIWTRAHTASEALADANIALGPEDRILLGDIQITPQTPLPPPQWHPPAHRRTAPPWLQIPTPLPLTILRAQPVQLIGPGGLVHPFWTQAETVAQALAQNDIPLHSRDLTFPHPDTPIQPGMRVLLRPATPIHIQVDHTTLDLRTRQKTVGDALREAGLSIQGQDRVYPALETPIHPNQTIRIIRVREEMVYEEELLPFETVWEPDDTLLIDTRRVGQEGQPGILRRRFRVRYENGQEVARTLEDEWVAQEPQRKVILYGRKIIPRTAMTPDGPITYWRKIRAYTTSYSPSRSGTDPSLPWYGHTRLGFKAGKGVVGVDPSVINMGQKLYVPGYGFAIAGDTGNIAGRHVDMGFDDWNYESWHWWSDIYLLWPPPPPYAINYILPNWPRYKGSRNPYAGLVQEGP